MNKFLTFLLAATFVWAASPHAVLAQEHSEYVGREDDSGVMGVSDENAAMNAAIDKAVDTVDVFFTALESGEHPRDSFMLKILTETAPGEMEHMWYIYAEFTEDEKISGLLTHNPYAEGSTYKAGEFYEHEPTMVTDWRYLDGQKLRGDFTTRVLISFMKDSDPVQAWAIAADYHENPLPE